MDIKLYYIDPTWDAACWAIANVAGSEDNLVSGLSALEAMRRCNWINRRNLQRGGRRMRSGSVCLNSFTPRDKETAGGLN